MTDLSAIPKISYFNLSLSDSKGPIIDAGRGINSSLAKLSNKILLIIF